MQADSGKSYDDINVTPMVDLYLVLLLIFIIMTTAGVQGIKVNLPRASDGAAKKMDQPKTQAITVNGEGNIFLNTIPTTPEALESKLAAVYASNRETPIVIRGESQAQYQKVMDVLDVVGRVGFTQIGLVTSPPK